MLNDRTQQGSAVVLIQPVPSDDFEFDRLGRAWIMVGIILLSRTYRDKPGRVSYRSGDGYGILGVVWTGGGRL